MIYKDIPSIYKALAALQEPFKILVVDTKESFFRHDCAHRYIAFCRQRGIDSIRIEPSDIAQHQQDMTEPYALFQQKKLYVVEDVTSLKERGLQETLHSLENLREGCSFLAIENGSANKQLSEIAQANGAVFVIPPIKPWEKVPFVTQWITAFVKKRSRSISPKAAALLAQGFQNDQHALVMELEKLIIGCEDSSCITEEDLNTLGVIDAQPTLFALFDAFLKKDAAEIASCFASQQEVYDIGLLRFFKSQLEKLISLAESEGEAKTKSQERQLSQVRAIGLGEIVSWINEIKMYEVDVRSGRREMNEEALLAFFLSLEGAFKRY
jgi:DNA polymerase III delta subunit